MHYPTVRLFTVNDCASLASGFSKRTPSAIVQVRYILGTQVSKRDSAIVCAKSILGTQVSERASVIVCARSILRTQVSERVCVIVRTIRGTHVFAHCSFVHKTGIITCGSSDSQEISDPGSTGS